MYRKYLALPVAAALALSLSACGKDADRTTTSASNDPPRIAQRPEIPSPMPGERPGSPANPRGLSDTAPSIPGSVENRPEKKDEQPFGQGSPQTSMKGADIPTVARPNNQSKAD